MAPFDKQPPTDAKILSTKSKPEHKIAMEEPERKEVKQSKSKSYVYMESVRESKMEPFLEQFNRKHAQSHYMGNNKSAEFGTVQNPLFNLNDMVEIFSDFDELPIRAGCFSPDGEYFCVGSNSKKLTIYSVESAINSFVTFCDPEYDGQRRGCEVGNILEGECARRPNLRTGLVTK